jgi:hypothetical protein
VSAVPPLPPVTRIEHAPATLPADEPHTLPGWVALPIYLACVAVLCLVILPRL